MAQTVQILRTTTNSAPAPLLPGAFSVELGTETRLWIGAAGGNRLLLSSAPADVVAGNFLPLIGGTMLGPLFLAGPPTVALHAATKQYVDTADNARLPLAGGTMLGPLVLAAAPAAPLQPATKQYVDTADNARLPLTGGALTGAVTNTSSYEFANGQWLYSRSTTAAQLQLLAVSGTNDLLVGWNVPGTVTVGATGGLAVTNGILTSGTVTARGAASGLIFEDRVAPGTTWQWYAQSGVANLFSSAAGAVKFAVSSTGLTLANGAITTTGIVSVGWVHPTANNAGYCGSPSQGFAQMNAYNYATLSDAALKTDVAPLPADCLGYVEAIEPKQFKYRPPAEPDPALEHITGRTHWGFVAQDVAAVTGESGFGGVTVDPESGVACLSYNDMVATLWQAVRELAAQVAALQGPTPALQHTEEPRR